jgi:hypothetical protein
VVLNKNFYSDLYDIDQPVQSIESLENVLSIPKVYNKHNQLKQDRRQIKLRKEKESFISPFVPSEEKDQLSSPLR